MMSIIQALLIYGKIIVGDPIAATGQHGTVCVGVPDSGAMGNGRKLGMCAAEPAKTVHGN